MGKLLSFPGRQIFAAAQAQAVATQAVAVPADKPVRAPGPRPDSATGWLTVRSVVKSFKKRTVVRGVSLDVARGEAVGLLGPNGAGKTTVFYLSLIHI